MGKGIDAVELEMIQASLPLMDLEELTTLISDLADYIKANAPHNLTFEQYKALHRVQFKCMELSIPLMNLAEKKEALAEWKEALAELQSQFDE